MFKRFARAESHPLDEVIARVMEEMETYGPGDDEYPKLVSYLERLTRLKAELRPPGVSHDTMAVVAGNLLGILIIVIYEQKHVMVSKGLGFILKPNK